MTEGPAADPAKVKARKQRAGLSQRQRAEDLAEVMETKVGRRVVFDFLNRRCRFFSISHSGELTHETAKLEGQRIVGHELVADLQRVAPSHFTAMLVELLGAEEPDLLDDIHKRTDSSLNDD